MKSAISQHMKITFRELHMLARAGARALDSDGRGKPEASLTEQQLEIIIALANGESATLTAKRLRVSPNMVRTHRRIAFARLGAHNAGQAVARAMSAGLITSAHLIPWNSVETNGRTL
ncbi:response regulator transcription factor [Streptomyces gamaensis]|uniref:Response regulator transcription factor n=1 Tax=Streptomyces gamaensis TaxID=1763542 RepID=A0ABW0ZAN2_9ACTN